MRASSDNLCFVAALQVPDPVQLILYGNGIVMFEGPFRSYEEESTQQCIADLMDGYFPTELQERYPEGVPFKVVLTEEINLKTEMPLVLTSELNSKFCTSLTEQL